MSIAPLVLSSFPPPRHPSRRKNSPQFNLERLKAIREAEKRQMEGIESQDIFKATVESKLIRSGAKELCEREGWTWFKNFLRCGVETNYVMCAECERGKEVAYQCSQKWCPRCNWRITMKRKSLMEKITTGAVGLKHVVLTQRNFDRLDREKIMQCRKNLFRLRKQKILGNVSGGCASLEFTNESRGWHMHWHLLLASPFVDAKELSVTWGKLVEQEFAIVKVKTVGDRDYLQELCKYVVSGSELAKWKPDQILEFVLALQKTRMFTTFGKFTELAKFARAMIATDKPASPACECGCTEKFFGHDEEMCRRMFNKAYSFKV